MAVSAASLQWKTAQQLEGNIPPARYGHTLTGVEGGVYLFGGADERETGSNFIYALDMDAAERFTWTQLDPTGQVPPGRLNHTASILDGSRLVIAGGWNDDSKALSDVHIFDTYKCDWKSLQSELIEGVSCHTAVVYDGKLYVYGGRTRHARVTDQLSVIDLDKDAVEKRLKAGGHIPSARYGHSASEWNGTMYIFGGWDIDGNRLDSLHALDLASMTWKDIHAGGDVPSPRSFHCSVTVSDSMVIYGGIDDHDLLDDLFVFSFHSEQWTRPPVRSRTPHPSSYPALAFNEEDMAIILYGGLHDQTKQDKSGLHDDIMYSYISFDSVISNASQWVSSLNPFATPVRASRRRVSVMGPPSGNNSPIPRRRDDDDSYGSLDDRSPRGSDDQGADPGLFGSISGALESWTPFLSPRKRPSQAAEPPRLQKDRVSDEDYFSDPDRDNSDDGDMRVRGRSSSRRRSRGGNSDDGNIDRKSGSSRRRRKSSSRR